MDEQHRVVHIGPISLFTLVASLGMAVLAVLAVSTSNAMYALADRAALMMTETYLADTYAQRFVAELDGVLADARDEGAYAPSYVEERLDEIARAAERNASMDNRGVQIDASMEEGTVTAIIMTPEARKIDLRVNVLEDGTYEIAQWKSTSEIDTTGPEDQLWSPPR